jgi:hypothetical protein
MIAWSAKSITGGALKLALISRRRSHRGRPLRVGDRKARANCQGGRLINRIAAGAPVRQLLVVEPLWHVWMPFAGYRPDHRTGVELAAIDPHCAPKVATDLDGRLDDGGAREARRDRLKICDFAGRVAAGHSVPPRSVRVRCAMFSCSMPAERSSVHRYCRTTRVK